MNIGMTKITGILALMVLVALSPLTAAAQSASEFTATRSEPHGKLLGDITPVTQDIYPVRFTYINGRPITGDRSALWLKPGEYRIQASVVADRMQRSVPGGSRMRASSQRNQMEPLEVVIEEGKNYHIGGLHMHREPGTRRQSWRLVLWKVDDGSGELEFPLREKDEEEDSEDEDEDTGGVEI